MVRYGRAKTIGLERFAVLRPQSDGRGNGDHAKVVLDASRHRDGQTVRLTVLPPVATFLLRALLVPFLEHYPDIVMEIAIESGLIDIVAGRFDAAFGAANS
jgi:DNA-binding transcriptional LysR family regulator